MAVPGKTYPPKFITPEEIAFLVRNPAGFPPAGARPSLSSGDWPTAVAIILAESNGNVFAHNPIPPDDSYGLAQINMIGSLGPARRHTYHLNSNEDLYKADLNVAIMIDIANRRGNGRADFSDWSTYKSGKFRSFLPRATEAVKYPRDPSPRLDSPEEVNEINNRNPLEDLLAWVQEQSLRAAGFVGGGVLIILALVLYVKARK